MTTRFIDASVNREFPFSTANIIIVEVDLSWGLLVKKQKKKKKKKWTYKEKIPLLFFVEVIT